MLDFQTLIADAIEVYGIPALGDMFDMNHVTIGRWGKGECAPGSYIEMYVRKILADAAFARIFTKVP